MASITHMKHPNGKTSWAAPYFSKLNRREKQLLGLVMRRSPISQSRLVKLSGIAQQSVSRIVKRLIDRGALRYGQRFSSGKRGQKQIKLEIVPDFAYSFGISIMTDSIYVTATNFAGQIIGEEHMQLYPLTQAKGLQAIRRMTNNLGEKYIENPDRMFGAGVTTSGYMLNNRSIVNTHPMLDDWALIDLAELLAEHLDLPVWLENDGNAAAIGESLVGAGRRFENFIYFYFATGFGGGVISNSELVAGHNGNAGELALLLPPNIYPHPNLDLLRHILMKNGIEVSSLSDLVARFDANWPGVDEWIGQVREPLSLVASAAAAILDTEAIVIGGRIPKSLAQRLIPHIKLTDNARRSVPRPLPVIIPAETEGEASSIGAAALPFKEYFFGTLR